MGTSQWSGPNSCNDIWQPVHTGADERRMGEYRAADQRACLYEATYLQQRQGKEAVNYGNALYGAEMKDIEDGGVVQVGNLRLREPAGRFRHPRPRLFALVLLHYRSVRDLASFAAQLRYALASPGGSTPVSRVVAIRAVCTPHCDETRTALWTSCSRLPFASHGVQEGFQIILCEEIVLLGPAVMTLLCAGCNLLLDDARVERATDKVAAGDYQGVLIEPEKRPGKTRTTVRARLMLAEVSLQWGRSECPEGEVERALAARAPPAESAGWSLRFAWRWVRARSC